MVSPAALSIGARQSMGGRVRTRHTTRANHAVVAARAAMVATGEAGSLKPGIRRALEAAILGGVPVCIAMKYAHAPMASSENSAIANQSSAFSAARRSVVAPNAASGT